MSSVTDSTVTILILLLQLFIIALLGFLLRRSMRKTIYSYTNISLIGGILFMAVMTAVHMHFMLSDHGGEYSDLYRHILAFPRSFSYYAAFVIIVVVILLAISNAELIHREGFCLHNALCLLIALMYLGGTAAAYAIADLIAPGLLKGSPLQLVLRTVIPLFFLLMLCYFECILAGTGILGWIAAKAVPEYNKDYIIILGCSIDKRGGLLPLLKGRVNRAIRFAWDQEIASGKPLKYVPSGGQGANEIMSEGSAMAFYLMTHGAEDYEVFPEKESRSTYENFLFSLKLIHSMDPNAKIAFATTNYHILRSGILARRAGIDAQGIAGDTKWYFWPNGFVREFFGILVLERKAHIIAALIIAVMCLLLGFVEYSAIPGTLV